MARAVALIEAAPPGATSQLRRMTVLAHQSEPFDRRFERDYKIPGFQAVASSETGAVIFYGGKIYSDDTFFHELGHVNGNRFLRSDWASVEARDDQHLQQLLATGSLTANQVGPVEPDATRRERWALRLQPGGLTGYAQTAQLSGTPREDQAEALRLRTSERWFGTPLVTFRDTSTGAERAMSFDELYPNRAAELDRIGLAPAR